MSLLRKKLFDDKGVLIKENDIVKVSKSSTGQGAIPLTAKYDTENQRWLFYTGDIVPFTLEDLKDLFHVQSIIVANDDESKKA